MAKQTINVGSSANDGTGDKIRVAFQKTNANFTELYDGKIDSVVAGTNVTVDNTDPLNPIVSATGGGGGSQTLEQTLVLGNTTGGENIEVSDGDGVFMDNGSRLIKGVTDAGTGGAKGIALKCSIDYEYKWEAGSLYVLEQNGLTVRETKYKFAITPTATDDSTKGFIVGSRWILDNGDLYICKDATSTAAVWELQIISGGGNGSLTYYLNGSVSQATIGGNAYNEMNSVPVIGAGTDFTISANGYIAQFLTDVGDPNRLIIPAGNWNLETYFSANSNGGSPRFYIELYKYDGATLTLLASNSATPEYITGGTVIDLYLTALAVPYTVLLATDRLAVRFYVINSGKTITMHTENSHLSEIITTFPTGVVSVNGQTGVVVLDTGDIADTTDKRYQTDTQRTNNDATSSIQTQLDSKQATLTETNFGTFANGLTAKTTPIDADLINIVDTADSNKQKKVTFTNVKAFLKTYFDTLYASVANLTLSGLTTLNGTTQTGSGAVGTLDINQTWNTTGVPTAVSVNVTNTASGALSRLLDLRVGGNSQFVVDKVGLATANNFTAVQNIEAGGAFQFRFLNRCIIVSPSNGVLRIANAAGNDFSRLQFGLTTSAAPAIKRNGANIEFRVADDTADTSITALNVISTRAVRLKGYTVATLPTGTVGDTVYVTDALLPTYLGTVAGGGAVTCTVFFNGTNWIT